MSETTTDPRELLLLGLLRRQEMHGYQLNEFLLGELSLCANIKKPTAYYLLKKMAEQGWIAESVEQEGNRPPRRVYRITPNGEQAFQQLLRQILPIYTPTYFESDLPLAYLDELPPTEARHLLKQRYEQLQQAQQALEQTPPHAGSVQWLIEHQRRHLRLEIELLEEILSHLAQEATI
ncbi:MAG: PadR family transcriptional regulator [Anaerolineae bacterium]|nr:MAG: PadR family transcriptional regulator [Anaerolineae bacterium]